MPIICALVDALRVPVIVVTDSAYIGKTIYKVLGDSGVEGVAY